MRMLGRRTRGRNTGDPKSRGQKRSEAKIARRETNARAVGKEGARERERNSWEEKSVSRSEKRRSERTWRGAGEGVKAIPREVVGVVGMTSRRNGAAFGVEGSRAIGREK